MVCDRSAVEIRLDRALPEIHLVGVVLLREASEIGVARLAERSVRVGDASARLRPAVRGSALDLEAGDAKVGDEHGVDDPSGLAVVVGDQPETRPCRVARKDRTGLRRAVGGIDEARRPAGGPPALTDRLEELERRVGVGGEDELGDASGLSECCRRGAPPRKVIPYRILPDRQERAKDFSPPAGGIDSFIEFGIYDLGTMLADLERAAHLIGLRVERAGRESGITQAEAHVLAHLARHGPASIASLHREFGTKRSTLTNVLDRLEKREFIRRELNPNDRRSFVIRLTRRGDVQARRVVRSLDELENAVRAALSERDIRGFEAVVDAIDAAVHRSAARAP